MTAESNTVTITNTSFETIASLTSVTMTSGKTYSIQVQGIAEIKIGDAIFTLQDRDGIGTLTQGDDDIYIRTPGLPAIFTILENA